MTITLVRPSRGRITQLHGNKQSHNGLPHGGQDYGWTDEAGNITTEVFAAADGEVIYAGDARKLGWPNQWYYNPDFNRADNVDQSAGNVVTIRHNQGGVKFDTTYNHLESWSVKKGQWVKAGQIIATMGNTGFSFGRHLHFELLFHPFNFGTATFGRSNPNPYFIEGLAAAGSVTQSKPAPKKESEMPVAKRVDSKFKARHRLPKGKAYLLSEKDDGISANFAVGGVGHYVINTHVRGQGLLAGQTIKARFILTGKDGKPSGHFEQDIVGTTEGTFNQPLVFNRGIEAGTTLAIELKSINTETAYVTGFGAEVATWKAS